MAQTQLNKGDVEVDLDTDDVKAQNVQVEPAKSEPEEKEVSLQKEEVEQEGAEINRDKTPIDVVTESKFKVIITSLKFCFQSFCSCFFPELL